MKIVVSNHISGEHMERNYNLLYANWRDCEYTSVDVWCVDVTLHLYSMWFV